MGFDKAKAIRAAEKYLAQGKIPAAIQEYRRIAEQDAEDYSALNTLGDLYARIDRKPEAVVCYRRVAEHYREQGFSLKAIAMYKKVTRFDPADHRTALSLASLYEQQGLMVDARAQYLIAADAFSRSGETREALDILRRIADLDPSNTQIRLRLAEGYAREDLPDLAAEAYTQAGERLGTRGEHEQALDAFNRALELRPAMHVALQGMLSAHIALGTADEAAERIEQALASRPGDLELRAMLARAYVEAEAAPQAERAAEALVSQDPSSFTLFFDVIRLYLRQGSVADAARLLGRVAEPALNGRQDETLAELLQEALARDPEQMEALHLLVRVYTWQREDERLRTALERLADAAESSGAAEEERKALTQLTRLAPDEGRYAERLAALGGPVPTEYESAADAAREQPSFESFMLNDDTFAAPPPAASTAAADTPSSEFEWNSVAPPAEAPDASASFADLNDLTDAAAAGTGQAQQPAAFHEIDFGSPSASADAAQEGGPNAERMLSQELESVDFYLEQGYADIARETLDMLERQFGAHAEIEKRRGLIPDDILAAAREPSAHPAVEFEVEAEPVVQTETFEVAEFAAFEPTPAPAPAPAPAPTPAQQPAAAQKAGAGIDPGLAAIFDEFRESVEDSGEASDGDFETHYNLGLAYREMGLLDQAVEEFQSAVNMAAPGDGSPRYFQCCNLLGHCFMQKELPRMAVVWFKKGLAAPGHSDDEYKALRYELGAAYEKLGDAGRAIEAFSEVYAFDVSYRGVADRLQELQKRLEARG